MNNTDLRTSNVDRTGRKIPMANLSVNNGVLQYKETSYQISQMTSAKPVTVKRERKINYVSLKPILPLLIIAFVFGSIGSALAGSKTGIELLFFAVTGGLLIYCYKRISVRISQNREDTHDFMYGISFYLANGDRELFISSDKPMILKIYDGISEAMKGNGGNLVNFANANIKISDSENFVIGGIDA